MISMAAVQRPDPDEGVVPLKRMVAIGLGNALEFYDFMIFSFFAVQIGHADRSRAIRARGACCWRWRPSAWASSCGPWARL